MYYRNKIAKWKWGTKYWKNEKEKLSDTGCKWIKQKHDVGTVFVRLKKPTLFICCVWKMQARQNFACRRVALTLQLCADHGIMPGITYPRSSRHISWHQHKALRCCGFRSTLQSTDVSERESCKDKAESDIDGNTYLWTLHTL